MSARPAQRPPRMKLMIQQRNSSLHGRPPLLQQPLLGSRILLLPVGAVGRRHRDPLGGELGTSGLVRPVGVVAQQSSAEGGLHQSVKSLDVVTMTGKLQDQGDVSLRGEDQMLAYALIPAFYRGAPAALDQAVQTNLLPGPDGSANIDGMGVYDEKGGVPSPSREQRAPESRSMRGVSSARRSAQLGRERRRGKSWSMTGLDSTQR